jgi:uncharacterized protein (TIGR03067 family)
LTLVANVPPASPERRTPAVRTKLLPALGLGLLLAALAPADSVKEELEKLTGTWRAVSVTEDGKEMPADKLKEVYLIVKGKNYTYARGTNIIKGTHKLDPSKKPRTIDAVRTSGDDKGKTLKGIYELKDDSFKVCFAAPGKDRPRGFSAKEGSGNRLIVLKRARKKP